jgi:formate dehydrogenase formation protein
MHLELLEVHHRIQARIPLPSFELSQKTFGDHQAEGRPLLRFEDIPLELTELRLAVRQTAEILRRFGALEEVEFQAVQALGRDERLPSVIGEWYRGGVERHVVAATGHGTGQRPEASAHDQVFALAMRPFLSRCAEVVQQRPELANWQHPHCALCGGEPDFAVITPTAERHLICSRCGLRWKFEPLTCPYCRNADRSRITSFATPDGRYRVYACDVCTRYLKAYDGRRASRPVMPIVDNVATLPLDAAAIQRGYSGG